MMQGQSPAGDRRGGARGYPLGRLALAALLIVAATLALRASLPRLAVNGPLLSEELPVAAILEGIVLALLIAVLVRQARAASASPVAVRLREVLRGTLIAAALAAPFCYLLTRHLYTTAQHSPVHIPTPAASLRFKVPPHSAGGLAVVAIVIDALAGGLLLAAIVTGVVLLSRRRWRLHVARRPPEAEEPGAGPGAADLRDAVEYGWLALRELDDARGAIIACYLAMEQRLATAGTARGAAETPDELLARASASGLIRGTAAARLTTVFYEARFSTRKLIQARRDTAEQALAEIAASLREQVP
ncbi:MAG TPA: DUF4129 domain-containing protein [Streptosporangiaceae bacterium]|jgi:hypothetical protein